MVGGTHLDVALPPLHPLPLFSEFIVNLLRDALGLSLSLEPSDALLVGLRGGGLEGGGDGVVLAVNGGGAHGGRGRCKKEGPSQ